MRPTATPYPSSKRPRSRHRSDIDNGGPTAKVAARHRRTVDRTRRRALITIGLTAGLIAGPAVTNAASADTYTVRSGDTLSEIAQQHGSSWRTLYQLNRRVVSSPSHIFVGQRLELGAGSGGQADQGTSSSGPISSSGAFTQRVLSEASKVEGVPYVYGGTSPAQGFDCSGFTSYVFARAGRTIPRTSAAQAAAAQRISSSQLQPGDLVFFTPSGRVSHVAIYAGNGMVWEAPSSGRQVRYAPIWNVPRFYGRI